MPNKIQSLLSPAQRRALESEVASSLIRSVLLKNYKKTFGEMVKNLFRSKYWSIMKDVRVSSILTPHEEQTSFRRVRRVQPSRVVEAVLTAIRKNPGLRSEQLQQKTKLSAVEVGGALAQLRREKRVKTKGDRRTMIYRVV